MPVEVAVRKPCERCRCVLYYHEQAQRFCRMCAAVLGIVRICDAPMQRSR